MNAPHPDLMAPVHSPFPYPSTNVALIQEIAEQGKVWWTESTSRELHTPFPTLPLIINDLLNTEWINIHIGAVYKITEFKTYNEHLYPATPINESSTITTTFGVWYADHFTIPTCIRYDNLTFSEKLNWLLIRITYITKHLDKAQHEAVRKPQNPTSELVRLRHNLTAEIARIKVFVQDHQLPFPLELHVIESRYLSAEPQLETSSKDVAPAVVQQIPNTPADISLQIASQKGSVMTTTDSDSTKPYDIHGKIYSPYPSDLDPQTIKTKWFASRAGGKQIECAGDGSNPAYVWSDTTRFPALPYAMNELIGSVWISPFDGHTETITGIVTRGDQPFLQTNVEIAPGKFATIGRWITPEQYAIDAVRYDTLTPSNQLGWLLIAYEYTTTMLKTAAINPSSTDDDLPDQFRQSAPYQAFHASKLADYQTAQVRQMMELQRFAQANNLLLPAALVGAKSNPVITPVALIEASTTKNAPEAAGIIDQDSPLPAASTTNALQASTPQTDQPIATNTSSTSIPVSEFPGTVVTASAAPETLITTSIQNLGSEPNEPPTISNSDATNSLEEMVDSATLVNVSIAALVTPADAPTQNNVTEATALLVTNDSSATKQEPEPASPPVLITTDTIGSDVSAGTPTQVSTLETNQTTLPSSSDKPKDSVEVTELVITDSAAPGNSASTCSGITSPDGEPTTITNTDTPEHEPKASTPSAPISTASTPEAADQAAQTDLKYDYSATIYARPSEPNGDPEALLRAYNKEVEAQKAASNPFKANKAIPATLYTFRELLGSTWVSLTAAKRETVITVMPIKSGNPQNRNKVYLLTEDPGAQYPTIGTYDNGRYVIATHVRYDHLAPITKHKWHLERLKSIRQQLSQVYLNRLTQTPEQNKGSDPREVLIAELEQELASEIKFAQEFAERHDQFVPADLAAPASTLLAEATQKANSAKQAPVTRPNIPATPTQPTIVQPKPTRVSTRPTLPPPPDTEKEMLVYSPFADLPPLPHVLIDSLRAAQREQITLNKTGQQSQSPLVNRDLYPSTPWTLQQLVGSTWVNLYTGHKVTVKGFYMTSGHYHLTTEDITEKEWPITRPFGAYHHKTQRYYIEHWVRIDNLPLATAIEWEAQALRHAASKCQQTESEINSLQTNTSKPSNWRSQVSGKKRDLERYMQEACEAAKHLQNYALQNMVPVPADITTQNLIVNFTAKKSRAKNTTTAPKAQSSSKVVASSSATAQPAKPAVSKTTTKPQLPSSTDAPQPMPSSQPQLEEKIPAGQLALF